MYKEIFRALMRYELTVILIMLAIAIFFSVMLYVIVLRSAKKKKQPLKKKQKKEEKDDTVPAIIVFLVFVFILIGVRIPRLFSLRKDMINETYITYTGEFYCYEHKSGKSSTEYVRFQNADGEQIEVEYSHHINKYQEHGKKLEEDTYYAGTIVYSPSSDYLLWWDAEPIGE